MALISLIYVSAATPAFKRSDILEILKASREANGKKGITGMLLYMDGNFMQVLEGEAEVVDELQRKIAKDPRHGGLITLIREPIKTRDFSDWKMAFKDLGALTPEEKAGRSDFLDVPLNDPRYASNPNFAFTLLRSFKDSYSE